MWPDSKLTSRIFAQTFSLEIFFNREILIGFQPPAGPQTLASIKLGNHRLAKIYFELELINRKVAFHIFYPYLIHILAGTLFWYRPLAKRSGKISGMRPSD